MKKNNWLKMIGKFVITIVSSIIIGVALYHYKEIVNGKDGNGSYRLVLLSGSDTKIIAAYEESSWSDNQILPENSDEVIRAYKAEAGKLIKQEKYAEAEAYLTNALKINPEHSGRTVLLGLRGDARSKQKKYLTAEEDFNRVIQLSPKASWAFFNRGNIYAFQNKFIKAIMDYNEAIKLNPDHDTAYRNRGLAKNRVGDRRDALDDYNKALELNPNALNYYLRGLAHSSLEEYQAAIQDFDTAIEGNPNYPEFYYDRGLAKEFLKNYQGAISDYDKAIKLNPNYQEAKEKKQFVTNILDGRE